MQEETKSGARMTKKKDERADRIARAILAEYHPKTADEAQDAIRSVFGPMIEAMLQGELDAHLGYANNDKSPKQTANRRNGYSEKRVKTSFGKIPIEVPRDRDCTFEPTVVAKGENDLSDIESKVLSLYAKGLSERDIASITREIYGFEISPETVSNVVDRISGELTSWRSRQLESIYAFMFVDCMFVSVRRREGARKIPLYVILAYDMNGHKDILGLWMAESEGAHFWMGVLGEVAERGVQDVLYVSMDGLAGLEEAVRATWPKARTQRCIVHLVRNAVKFVPHVDMKKYCADARAFYAAPSLQACRDNFAVFKQQWEDKYPGAVRIWERNIDQVEQLFDAGPDVRKIMYTTNAVESVNSSLRKVIKKGSYPSEDAVLKLMYLRVKELYGRWGTGRRQPSGWKRVFGQLMCDESMATRIEALWLHA